MPNFTKSQSLNNVTYDIRGPILKKANEMAKNGEEILQFNIGNPAAFDFKAPECLMQALSANMTGVQGYSDSKGILPAREAIAKRALERGIEGVTVNDVYTGNGVSELILLSMQAILNSGDEILVPAPDYPLWTSAINLFGGKPVHYLCDESAEWYPDIDDIKKKITPRTRGIVIINPNNPTGALYPREVLCDIVDVARKNDLIIFSDEIYERLIMEGEHISTASLCPDVPVFTYNGLSKSHLLTGYRCGWMTVSGPREATKEFIDGLDLLASMRLCSNVPAQSLIPTALENGDATRYLYMPGGRIWEQRECVYNALISIPGITAVKPKAAFYIFPRVDAGKYGIKDDAAFALDLLMKEKVLIVQGTGFNWPEPDHFRMVYLAKEDILKKAASRMADYFSKL